MLPEHLRNKFRRLELSTKKSVDSAFGGEYVSAFKGQGMEFSEVRLYQPGDEIRMIDWNVTARTGEPHIKLHTEERELLVFVLVDVSGSGHFGSVIQLKRDVIIELASLVTYAAANHNDKVGLALFTDQLECFIPAKKGMKHAMRIIESVFTTQPKSKKTSLSAALESFMLRQKKRALVFLISDFMSESFEKPLRVASRKHDMVAIRVSDPREMHIPSGIGLVTLEDPESGETQIVNLNSKELRKAYELQAQRLAKNSLHQLQSSRAELLDVSTTQDPLLCLRQFMVSRKRRLA